MKGLFKNIIKDKMVIVLSFMFSIILFGGLITSASSTDITDFDIEIKTDTDNLYTTAAALTILKAIAELIETTDELLALYDFDGTGVLTTGNALKVLRIAAGLEDPPVNADIQPPDDNTTPPEDTPPASESGGSSSGGGGSGSSGGGSSGGGSSGSSGGGSGGSSGGGSGGASTPPPDSILPPEIIQPPGGDTTPPQSTHREGIQYEYDRLGRLIKVVYDDKNYIEYEYDTNGNIIKITTVINGIKQ